MLYTIDAIPGLGSALSDSPDGTTYTAQTGLAELGTPSQAEVEQIEIVDVTTGAVEQLNGTLKGGKFEFSFFYNATRYTHFLSRRGQRCWYKITLPDLSTHSTVVVSGNLTKVYLDKLSPKESIIIKCEVQIVGGETFTAGS